MFDRYVVAQTKPSWKRRALMIASIGLHGVAAVVLIVWSFIHVEEIAPPALSLTFFSAPPPPPPPPPPAGRKKPQTEIKKPVEHKMVQPTEIPKIVQPKQEEKKEEEPEKDEPDGVEGGEEGGVKGGEVGGVKGGVVGGVKGGVVGGNGTDLNAKAPAPKIVPMFTLLKDQISHPPPHLPEAVKDRFKGTSVTGYYKICLRNDGHVSDVTTVTPILGADQEIMSQIKAGWTYKPQAVPVCFTAVVKFDVR